MAWYLQHEFDPDFDHLKRKPRERKDGSVNHYDLQYVQNVVKGQVLARLKPVDGEPEPGMDPRFLLKEAAFPAGENTLVDPKRPGRLVAAESGFVHYDDNGLIEVRTLLNIRRDLDFNTGNITFVGDVVVHGELRSGFRLRGRGVRAKGVVGGARISAEQSIVCESGVKGQGTAVLDAGRSIKAAYVENAMLRAGENLLIEGACMHSTLFAGGKLAVKGRMTGGDAYAFSTVYVSEQLGGGIGAATSVMVGYDPVLVYSDMKMQEKIKHFRDKSEELTGQQGKADDLDREIKAKLAKIEKKLTLLRSRRSQLWDRIYATEKLEDCRIMVPGKVKPGVEISIGPAYLKVDDYLEDVSFVYSNMDIEIISPAISN